MKIKQIIPMAICASTLSGNAIAAICGTDNCTSDTIWTNYDTTREIGKCTDGTICGYRCKQNYYGTADTLYACTKCPSYQSVSGITTNAGKTQITDCYISKNSTMSDEYGTYEFFASDCYYTKDSGGGGGGWSPWEIEEKVKDIIVDQLNVEPEYVIPDAHIFYDLGADSLDAVELVMTIEDTFGLEIPDVDAEKLLTVRDICDYLQDKLG